MYRNVQQVIVGLLLVRGRSFVLLSETKSLSKRCFWSSAELFVEDRLTTKCIVAQYRDLTKDLTEAEVVVPCNITELESVDRP